MNKNIYTISVLAAALAIGTGSCKNEEDDIFPESSAVRLEKAKKETAEALCAAPNGWILQYFPSVPDYAAGYAGGYTFHLDFTDDKAVALTACNFLTGNQAQQETSVWDMIADDGPVLTLNSFNDLFHVFSEPQDDGVGFGGDYEFVVMNVASDTIMLRGKKTAIDCPLIKLPEGQDPKEYVANVRAEEVAFSNNAILPLLMTTGAGENFEITDLSEGQIAFVPQGGDAITETQTATYLHTGNGVRLMSPYKGHNDAFAVQNFAFDADGRLICKDEEATIAMGNVAGAVANINNNWTVNREGCSAAFAAAIDAMEAGIVAYNAEEKRLGSIQWMAKSNGTVTLRFRMNKSRQLDVIMTSEMKGDGQISVTYNSARFTGKMKEYFNNVPAVKTFLDMVASGSTASVSVNHMISPSDAKLTYGSEYLNLTK